MENNTEEENSKSNSAESNDNSNRSEQENQNTDWRTIEEDPTKINIDSNLGELASGTLNFLKSTLSLRHGNYKFQKVVNEAKENVVFKGYNVWILICSIVVASVGLNMDSVAVVIGAMLISPLMGPIRGIGFGVGMNDFPLLISSVKNFGVMVGISLVTSIIYFLITPIDIENAQLLGRTQPNFLDAVIAFFGGLAGIIASSNGKNDTVINGVAIATALMPPLCTAGWGIANAEWGYFIGASYLFLLNSLFIALSTVVLLRYLKFPKREYLSDKVERRVQNYIIIFLVVILAPSGYLFYKMTKKSIFESNVIEFVEQVVKPSEENMIVSANPIFSLDGSVIELSFANTYIDSTMLGIWNRAKVNHNLEDATIKIIQGHDDVAMMDKKIKEALGLSGNQNELINLLKEKELLIVEMEKQFEQYQTNRDKEKDPVNFDYLLRSFKAEYSEINDLSINRGFSYQNEKVDTNYVIAINFKKNISAQEQQKVKSRINKKFCFELKEKANVILDSVSVINF